MKTVFIAWQDPESRQWFPVGRLSYDGNGYRFVYTQGAIVSSKFVPFGAMRDLHFIYESKELFPLFANRLLSKNRPEHKDYLDWLNIPSSNSDPLDELARTGGIRATDSLVVFPCPEPQPDGNYSLTFFGHGLRHLPSECVKWVEALEPGRRLYLMLDNQNEHDPLAIAMRTEPVMVVGYVPRYYTEDFRKLLASTTDSTVHVSVEKVNVKAPIQMRLLCKIKAPWPADFHPCMGDVYKPLALVSA
jgi:hypothetical protein